MLQKIGVIKELYRYPVKSMASEELKTAVLGWRGIDGDRRFAFRIVGSSDGFPWLNASKHRELIGYKPYGADSLLPDRVISPSGKDMELNSAELRQELSEAYGSEVQMMYLKQGVFDEADISLISTATINEIGKQSGLELDTRRFRPNIVIELTDPIPFQEDRWIGRVVLVEGHPVQPAITITMKDLRCVMINFDPYTMDSNPNVLKTVGRIHDAYAGVYGSTFKAGKISVGDSLYLQDDG